MIREEKVARVANVIPDLKPDFADEGDLLVIGWGGTFGSLHSTVGKLNHAGYKVGHAHFNYINPMPKNTAEVFGRFKKIIVCELNKGQLAFILKGKYQDIDFMEYNQVSGLPFSVTKMVAKFKDILKEE
jgi:2-oxoglutarate ferredoxin oxidoreductase subunit alpha